MPKKLLGPDFSMQEAMERQAGERARGNTSTNIRGDTVDAAGNIIKTVAEKAKAGHIHTERTRESLADVGFSPAAPEQESVVEPEPIAADLDADLKADSTIPAEKESESPADSNDDLVEDADGNFVPKASVKKPAKKPAKKPGKNSNNNNDDNGGAA